MSKMYDFMQTKQEGPRFNNNVAVNIRYARGWYKSKQWHENVKVRLSSSGSSSGDAVDNAIVEIGFKPPLGVNFLQMAVPVNATEPHNVFIEILNNAYNQVNDHAQKMEKKKEEGTLKLCPIPKKGQGMVQFK